MPNYNTFDKRKSYKFGVLKEISQNNSITPEFRNNPRAVTISGSYLKQIGCNNFEDYLKMNPHNYAKTVTIACFVQEPDKEGMMTLRKIAEGNPYPTIDNKEKEKTTLADVTPQQIQLKMPEGKNDKALMQQINQQIEYLQENNNRLESRNNELHDKIIAKEEELLNLKADLNKVTFERDKLNEILKEISKPDEKTNLADSVNGILQNPLAAQLIGMASMYIQNKFMPPGGQITQQPGMQNMQDNFDGVSPRPGEFDNANPL